MPEWRWCFRICSYGRVTVARGSRHLPWSVCRLQHGSNCSVLYAAGYSPSEMLQMIKDDKLYKVTKLMTFRPAFLKSGLSNHTILRSLIKELIPHNSFDQLKKGMHIAVVNLSTAESGKLSAAEMSLTSRVAASAKYSGRFESIKHNDIYYVDGGLLEQCSSSGTWRILSDNNRRWCNSNTFRQLNWISLLIRFVFRWGLCSIRNSREGRELCRFLIEPAP